MTKIIDKNVTERMAKIDWMKISASEAAEINHSMVLQEAGEKEENVSKKVRKTLRVTIALSFVVAGALLFFGVRGPALLFSLVPLFASWYQYEFMQYVNHVLQEKYMTELCIDLDEAALRYPAPSESNDTENENT